MSRLIFGSFVLEAEIRQLTRKLAGEDVRVRLSGAEVAILEQLLANEGVVQSKEDLLSIGWSGRPVSPNSLPVAIANLRRHLQGPPPEVEIRTLPREGYLLKLASGLQLERLADEPVTPSENGQDHVAAPEETTADIPAAALPPGVPVPPTYVIARPRLTTQQRLVRLNIACLVVVVIFVLVTVHEWVPVDCAEEPRGTVCIVDDAQHDAAALELPTNAGQRLIAVSGDAWLEIQRGVPARDRPVSEPARGL